MKYLAYLDENDYVRGFALVKEDYFPAQKERSISTEQYQLWLSYLQPPNDKRIHFINDTPIIEDNYTIEDLVKRKRRMIDGAYNVALQKLETAYPEKETKGWYIQIYWLTQYLAGIIEPGLQRYCDEEGVSVGEKIALIDQRVNEFGVVYGALTGTVKKLKKNLDHINLTDANVKEQIANLSLAPIEQIADTFPSTSG